MLLDATHLYGVRDPQGFRPLCLGRLGPAVDPEGWVLASETPALDVIGATFVRELEPGELVTIGPEGVRSVQLFPAERVNPRLCIFEFVYFARPDASSTGARSTAPGAAWASCWPTSARSTPTSSWACPTRGCPRPRATPGAAGSPTARAW